MGAGGNAGAVLAGFLFKTPSLSYPQAFLILGVLIACCSVAALAVRFSERDELAAQREIEARQAGLMAPAVTAARE